MKYSSCLFLLFVSLISCQNHEPAGSIDLTADTPMSVFELFSEVKVVPLETNTESLITSISKVQYYQSQYYILDDRSQQIFCFNDEGDFVFKIAAQGKGPGEYNYITNFSIDEKKNKLIVPDPVVQRVHFYDLQGKHLETRTIDIPNILTKAFPLNDSVLLIYSLINEQLVFYNMDQDIVVSALYNRDVPISLGVFNAHRYVYQLKGRTYALPSLSREVMDITDIEPVPHFNWCFGSNNNSPQQIEALLQKMRNRKNNDPVYRASMQGVGRWKELTSHIDKVFESSRFRLALVEFDGNMKHVVIDKETNKTFVFNHFKEKVGLFRANFQPSRVITTSLPLFNEGFVKRLEASEPDFPIEYYYRNPPGFSIETLSADDRKIVENHDPMTDNPFLVVYTFRE